MNQRALRVEFEDILEDFLDESDFVLETALEHTDDSNLSDRPLKEAVDQLLLLLERQIDQRLKLWARDIEVFYERKCQQCSRLATEQYYKGSEAQKNLDLPRNWGWYCKKHADEARELEREAMYG